MNAEKIGKLIYELRTRKNLTQKELAEKINISDKAVSKWERGEGCPDISIIPSLAEVLGIEVDSLINGTIPLTQDVSGKNIKDYNFRQPDRYSREMQRDIAILGDDLRQFINGTFTSLLNERFESCVGTVDQMVNIEFLRTLPKQCFFYDFDYDNNGFCIVADDTIGKALLKQDYKKYGEVTDLDLEMFKAFYLQDIVNCLAEKISLRTENKISDTHFFIENIKKYGNPNFSLQEETRMMILLGLECSIGETKGWINIQLSEGFLNELMENGFFNQTSASRVVFQDLVNIKEKQLPDNIFVEFGRYRPENVSLEHGKILILDKKETEGLNVVFENRVIHSGKTVSIDENWGIEIAESVQLNEIVYDEEEYISVQLGSAYLTKEDIVALHQGSYLILKQRAGEFCKIIRSGKIIGTGEICIADDRFAIRITDVR